MPAPPARRAVVSGVAPLLWAGFVASGRMLRSSRDSAGRPSRRSPGVALRSFGRARLLTRGGVLARVLLLLLAHPSLADVLLALQLGHRCLLLGIGAHGHVLLMCVARIASGRGRRAFTSADAAPPGRPPGRRRLRSSRVLPRTPPPLVSL